MQMFCGGSNRVNRWKSGLRDDEHSTVAQFERVKATSF
jgi:hypothetical protein